MQRSGFDPPLKRAFFPVEGIFHLGVRMGSDSIKKKLSDGNINPEKEEIMGTTKQKMARRHNKEGGNHLEQESNGQRTMEGIKEELYPAVDGQSLGERWNRKATDRGQWKALVEGYILQWMDKAKVKGDCKQKMARRHNKEGGNHLEQESDRGQWKVLMEGYILQ